MYKLDKNSPICKERRQAHIACYGLNGACVTGVVLGVPILVTHIQSFLPEVLTEPFGLASTILWFTGSYVVGKWAFENIKKEATRYTALANQIHKPTLKEQGFIPIEQIERQAIFREIDNADGGGRQEQPGFTKVIQFPGRH